MRLEGLANAALGVLDRLDGIGKGFKQLAEGVINNSAVFTAFRSDVFSGTSFEIAKILGTKLDKAEREFLKEAKSSDPKNNAAMAELNAAGAALGRFATMVAEVQKTLKDKDLTLTRTA